MDKKERLLLSALILGVFLVFLVFALLPLVTKSSKVESSVVVNGYKIFVEIADDGQKRAQGLSGRLSLGEDKGMLFLFPQPGVYPFWMKEMMFDLDFVYIKGASVVDIVEKVAFPKEGELPRLVTARVEFDKVLEINAGVIQKRGIEIGERIDFR